MDDSNADMCVTLKVAGKYPLFQLMIAWCVHGRR